MAHSGAITLLIMGRMTNELEMTRFPIHPSSESESSMHSPVRSLLHWMNTSSKHAPKEAFVLASMPGIDPSERTDMPELHLKRVTFPLLQTSGLKQKNVSLRQKIPLQEHP